MPMTAAMSNPVGGPSGSSVSPTTRRRVDQGHTDGGDHRSVTVPGLARPIRVKLASERDEFEQAFRLVADRYRSRGYDTGETGAFRFTPYHALPGTVTFIAKDGDRVVATLSMVPDNATLGLPMESIYGDEVARLRDEGRALAEVTCLAEEGLTAREFLQVFSTLIRVMFQYHVRHGGDSWVITVNPRHSAFYRRVLGFVQLGPCRAYSSVGNHPAEAYLLDVDLMREGVPEKYLEVFGEGLPWPVLTAVSKPADHAHSFGKRSTQADYRTILEVMAAARQTVGPRRRGTEGEPAEAVEETREATVSCGSWHSKRCSPTGADC